MGLFNSVKQPPPPAPLLAPSTIPIGVLPAFTQHQTQMSLKVREKKIAMGDDFSVKDAVTGQKVFEVDGKMFSMHSRKEVYDAAGKKIYTLKKKLIALHTTYEGIAPTEETLFTIKGGWGVGAKLTITFKNLASTGADTKLHLKGDWFDRRASITTDQGIPIAEISRSFLNAGQIFFDDQTYILSGEFCRGAQRRLTRMLIAVSSSQLPLKWMHRSCLPSVSASTRLKTTRSDLRTARLKCTIARRSSG